MNRPSSKQIRELLEHQWREGKLASAIKTKIKWYWEFNNTQQNFQLNYFINNPGSQQRKRLVHMRANYNG